MKSFKLGIAVANSNIFKVDQKRGVNSLPALLVHQITQPFAANLRWKGHG
jgi:hypothetical protein